MALREIGAKLTLEGEQEWNRQMKAADRELKTLKAELAASSAAFQGNANSVEALRAKQELLQRQQAQQTEKVRALKDAVAQATEMYGEASPQVDKLRQSYAYAQAALSKMSAELDETTDYLEEAESSADGCASSIDGYGKKVKSAAQPTGDTAEKVRELGEAEDDAAGGAGTLLERVQKLVPGLNAAKLASGLTAAGIAGSAKKVFDWAMNLVDSTAELRQQLTGLEISAGSLGVAMDDTMNAAMRTAYEASGDMGTAIKTVAELLQARYSSGGMLEVLEQLRGAVIAFPDTLKIDSLAEGLQKTLATGQADGQFKDMLERLGVDVDALGESLSACTTQAERQNVVMRALADSGLSDMTAEYQAAADASIALKTAQYDLEMANARLAESFEPVKAKLVEAQASFTDFLGLEFGTGSLGGSYSEADDLLKKVSKAGSDLTMQELLDTLENAGLTFGTVTVEARKAGQGVGEFVAQLHADQVEEAARAQEELAAQEQAEADAAIAAAEAQEASMAALEETKGTIDGALETMAELQATYEGIRAGIDAVATGFTDLSEATEQYETTSDDMIAALQSQLDYMDSYKENLLAAQELGLSDALIEEFSDGSAQSAAYLEAIVADGGEHIEELNAKFAEVEQGKQAFVDTVAEALPGFTDTVNEITATLNAAVDDWNQNAAAQAAGANTIGGLITGLSGHYAELFAMGAELGSAVTAGYNSALDIHSPSRVMARAMDYTVQGALQAGQRRLEDMAGMGEDLGESILSGYRRTAEGSGAGSRGSAPGGDGRAAGGGEEVLQLLRTYLPDIQKVASMKVVTETGALVGALAPGMDEDLGQRAQLQERGMAV